MIACLICPSERPAVQFLAERSPFALLPLMGQSLLEYWMAHLVTLGCKSVLVLAHDRAEQVERLCGKGKRWGLEVEVVAEPRPFTPAQALLKYREKLGVPDANNVWVADHFPGMPELPLFESYAGFYRALAAWIPRAKTIDRVGIRELKPGVFVETHAYVAPDAQLRSPCWIGRNAFIGARAIVGPGSVVESGAFLEPDTEVAASYVSADTFVGRFAQIVDSLAWDNTLIDWQSGSAALVPDKFLLCGLGSRQARLEEGWFDRVAEAYSRNKAEVLMACKQLLMRKES